MYTTSITSKRAVVAVALTTATVLVLTGCSGGENVYDFTQVNGIEPTASIEVRIPDALEQAAGADAGQLLVSSLTATSRSLDGSAYCAIDVDVAYAAGAVEALTEPDYTQDQADEETKAAQQAFLDRFEVGSAQELEQQKADEVQRHAQDSLGGMWGPKTVEEYLQDQFGTSDLEVAAAHYLLRLSTEAVRVRDQFGTIDAGGSFHGSPGVTVEQVVQAVNADIEQEHQQKVEAAAQVPAWERIADPLGVESAKPRSEMDEQSPEEGSYFSDDLTRITLVQDCATSPTDREAASSLRLPTAVDGGVRDFAGVEIAGMRNGTLSIVAGDVSGYTLDANGDWIAR